MSSGSRIIDQLQSQLNAVEAENAALEDAQQWLQFQRKMEGDGLGSGAINAFKAAYDSLVAGSTGLISESKIAPASDIPFLEPPSSSGSPSKRKKSIREQVKADTSLLKETVMVKLNGGLGTGMGLDKAKSLLEVKDGQTFLDLIAQQVLKFRKDTGMNVKFMLMNSFSTSADTVEFLKKYPELGEDFEFLQNKVPKIDAKTLQPAEWPKNPNNEWCPPGHGDLYAALSGSGKLDQLLSEGYKYMFVSNSDNLGATLDVALLTHFAQMDAPFLMECCERTENDKKGGHLALRMSDQRLILRESAQCADVDTAQFQDISRHCYFNTNNLWVRLDRLKEALDARGGFIHLPMIKNAKTVDPKDGASPKVFQLETAMGAAIECFEGASAVVVGRDRFAPVKKCSDLLLLRSDAYAITPDFRITLAPTVAGGKAPIVALDSKAYKLVPQLEAATPKGVPSMVKCTRLTISGKVVFEEGVELVGDVEIEGASKDEEPKVIKAGTYTSTKL